jgi:plasmid replication initiation protein
MNFTRSTTFRTTWRQIKGQYVALATGVALAAAAAIGYAGWEEAGAGARNLPAPVGQRQATGETTQGTDFIYIVGSEAERERLLGSAVELAELQAASSVLPGQLSVIVAPEGDAQAEFSVSTVLDKRISGVIGKTQILDLR